LKAALGADDLYVLEGGRSAERFVQGSDFHYLTGVDEPDLVLVIGRGVGAAGERLYLPPRNRMTERWDGPRLFPGKEAEEATGIAETREKSRLEDDLVELSAGRKTVHVERDPAGQGLAALFKGPAGSQPGAAPRIRRPGALLHAARQVKSPAEIALLRTAIETTGVALAEAIRSVEPGMYEHELQALIEYVFRRRGSDPFPGFPSIVGSGPFSCVLHYTANSRRMEAGDLVVMDVGAAVGHYTADVTRTVPVSGRFTPEQRRIYEIVLEAQKAGIATVRPGASFGDPHRAAREVIAKAGYAQSFLHGTSHWLGLDVHDVGREMVLRPGMVLTVEPGIYLPEKNLGVRIEDDVLVTADGCEVLSAGCPREVDELEALLREPGLGNARPGGLPRPAAATPAER
jgi:Xaa-Pro aminopeptidase